MASPRAGAYAVVSAVNAPDKNTVEFKLKYPSASFQTNLASPWNFIYNAAKLKADPRWYEKNILGTGPFTYDGNTKGQDWKGKKNPDYFGKDKDGVKLPYLDAYKALIITDSNAGVTAIRSKQAMIEFRGFTPQQRDDLSRALPNDLAIQEAPWICVNYVVPNTTKKPFDDPRVRRALSLSVDRWAGGEALSKTTIVKDVGGLMRPKGPFAQSRHRAREDRRLRQGRQGQQGGREGAPCGGGRAEPHVQVPQPQHLHAVRAGGCLPHQ